MRRRRPPKDGFDPTEVALTGTALPVRYAPRRAGDPPELVADAAALNARFRWQPKLDDLTEIVRTSLAWERKLVAGLVSEGRARA